MEQVELFLDVDPVGRRVEGQIKLHLRARRGSNRLRLDAAELELKQLTLGGAQLLRFEQDGDALEISFENEVAAGALISVEVSYSARPRRGIYFVGPTAHQPERPLEMWTHGQPEDGRAWFPTLDTPFDKAPTRVEVRVPERFFALSNGGLRETRTEDRHKIYCYEQKRPHAAYLVSVVVGEYTAIESHAGSTPILSYVHPKDKERGEHTFGRVAQMLRFFERRFQVPYPYPEYRQICVADFVLGGMENTSATTLSERILHSPNQAPDMQHRSDGLIAHELSHQWFGNLVTANEWAQSWLHEGFATYAEILWCQESRGKDEADYERLVLLRRYLEQSYRRSLVERRYVHPLELFDRHLYEKGALVLHGLRCTVGDSVFFDALKGFLTDHADATVGSVDLQRAFFDAGGYALDADFDQWVYAAGHPILQLTGGWSEAEQAYVLEVEQQQEVPFSLKVRLDVVRRGERQTMIWKIKDAKSVLHIAGPKPDYLSFDPRGDLLAEVTDKRATSELMRIANEDSEVRSAIAAVAALIQSGQPRAIAAVESVALEHRAACVRIEAARCLGQVVGEDPKDTLMAVTLEDGEVRVRRAALASLGCQHLYAEEVSDFLIRHADIERSDFALADSLAALAELGAEGSLEFVRRCLDRASFDDVVEAAAVTALARLRATECAADIHTRLDETTAPRVRAAAARALGDLAAGWPAKSADRVAAAERLKQSLHDPWYPVRANAADAVATLNEHGAIQQLRRVARQELDGRVLRTLREALDRLATQQAPSQELETLRQEVSRLADGQRRLQAKDEARDDAAPDPAPELAPARSRIARARALLEGRRG